MKKVWFIIIGLLVVFFGSTYIASKQLPEIVAYIVSKKTKTHVHVGHLSFGLDSISIHNLLIASPDESKIKNALKVDQITITTPFFRYALRPLLLSRVYLENIYMGIDFYDKDRTKGNWVTIMDNMSGEDVKDKSENEYGVIGQLDMENLSVDLKLKGDSPIKLSPIPRIQYKNVRTDNGQISEELAELIIKRVMYTAIFSKGIKTIISVPKDIVNTIIFPFTWFGSGEDKKEENGSKK